MFGKRRRYECITLETGPEARPRGGGMTPGSVKDPMTLRRVSLRRNRPYRAGFTQVCGLPKQVREGGKGVDVTCKGVVITLGREI